METEEFFHTWRLHIDTGSGGKQVSSAVHCLSAVVSSLQDRNTYRGFGKLLHAALWEVKLLLTMSTWKAMRSFVAVFRGRWVINLNHKHASRISLGKKKCRDSLCRKLINVKFQSWSLKKECARVDSDFQFNAYPRKYACLLLRAPRYNIITSRLRLNERSGTVTTL